MQGWGNLCWTDSAEFWTELAKDRSELRKEGSEEPDSSLVNMRVGVIKFNRDSLYFLIWEALILEQPIAFIINKVQVEELKGSEIWCWNDN